MENLNTQQIHKFVEKYHECCILMRDGDDYVFVTRRPDEMPKRFNHYELDTMLPKLINTHKLRVAICDALTDEEQRNITQYLKEYEQSRN